MSGNGTYAHPEYLAETDWVEENINNPKVRILECNEDLLLYEMGHIPNSLNVDWYNDLNDPVLRDYLDAKAFKALMERMGITRDMTVVFYGDTHNWWASYALWVFDLFGHPSLKLMNGGREKWESEDRPLTDEEPNLARSEYPLVDREDSSIRAFYSDVLEAINNEAKIVDVRTPEEFSGRITHLPEYPQESTMRGGHIKGAKSAPWVVAVNRDGTFKTAEELKKIYGEKLDLNNSDDIITYCRIGERSSPSRFVLKYLLGYDNVRNYDGSWCEFGNIIRAPIER
jgi:thiosulfate/3-mercaptopyruvate sulfurtransferase